MKSLIEKLILLRDEPKYADTLNADIYSVAINDAIAVVHQHQSEEKVLAAMNAEPIPVPPDRDGYWGLLKEDTARQEPKSLLSEIIGLLEPISEQDWHGKWRIQKAITMIRQYEAGQSQDVVERVARAICWKEHEGRIGMDSPEESWATWHSRYETLAEAAIAAIGAPTIRKAVEGESLCPEQSPATPTSLAVQGDLRGLPMSSIRVGMRLKTTTSPTFPIITVTELTDKGFKYTHPPHNWGSRMGTSKDGECYGVEGYSYYTEVESPKP